jgi:hypothetical protein
MKRPRLHEETMAALVVFLFSKTETVPISILVLNKEAKN